MGFHSVYCRVVWEQNIIIFQMAVIYSKTNGLWSGLQRVSVSPSSCLMSDPNMNSLVMALLMIQIVINIENVDEMDLLNSFQLINFLDFWVVITIWFVSVIFRISIQMHSLWCILTINEIIVGNYSIKLIWEPFHYNHVWTEFLFLKIKSLFKNKLNENYIMIKTGIALKLCNVSMNLQFVRTLTDNISYFTGPEL